MRWGHPLFDIANTIVMNKLDDAMAEQLLTDYARLTRYDVELADITEWLDLVDWLNNLVAAFTFLFQINGKQHD